MSLRMYKYTWAPCFRGECVYDFEVNQPMVA